ncbi:hypothetical protein Curi_c08650 [Gottschalkia acidurici 9a]|uniref:Uncharacterized protein n=1 Tax=Gottschalkia acidurici (strain ATCC 7906 / DSM 604 / BCRC 14475 / CIP 104303 / KCTC 5404 / NCIMB 10678 / 9a) TaxID=1128398 RepID=K0AZ23_GOTA9|nr:DUF523 domain-containing protein [Gottschalkia acidurici]AFS77935.1 hypothetical protein Curi_c08650 [Gottschalkia acidurici 9a]
MYIISACLAGIDCKYDGKNNKNEKILKLVQEGKAILVCPEQLGGLSTPRLPSEIVPDNGNVKVISNNGKDVTENFLKGAEETLKIAKMMGIKKAILKARSPSCGYGKIYDGTFSKTIIKGNGVTSELLEKNGIKIYTEEDL